MDQTKQAYAPIAAQLIAALMGVSLMGSDAEHAGELEQQAELVNELARAYEAKKMEQTTQALSPKMASAAGTVSIMVKVAAAVTAAGGDQVKLAWLLEREGLDKEAFGPLIAGLARAGGAALKGLGGAVGRLRPPTSAPQQFRQAWQGASTAPKPGGLQRAGGWLTGQGDNLAAKGQQMAKAAPVAAPAAQAAPAAAQGGPLLSAGTKAKMLGGGALLGAGYLGMKGLQAGRDYMMQPSGSHHGAPLMHNVNQHGYPQY